MKTTKYILFILLMSVSTMVWAVEVGVYQTSSISFRSSSIATNNTMLGSASIHNGCISTAAPTIQFQSTSTMCGSGSTLSSTTNTLLDSNEPNNPSNNGFSGPRKSRPGDNKDPGLPITDAVPCLLALAALYALRVRRKHSLATPGSGRNQ